MDHIVTGPCPRCSGAPPAIRTHAGLFRCTRCGLAGGPVQYLVASGATAVEAAAQLGVSLTTPTRVLRTLQTARGIYEHESWSEPAGPAMRFLQARGIMPQTAARFSPGRHTGAARAHPSLGWRGSTLADLVAAGLVRGATEEIVESLRSRLIFPLCDFAGRTIAFAGRALHAGPLKYSNTTASAAGSPRETLFGLPQAKRTIQRNRVAWVVEGYFDVLTCHQAGLNWTVGAGGTHVTIHQALLLRRLTPRVVLLLDGDATAQAWARALKPLRSVGLEVRGGRLPPGIDPDELVLREGPDMLVRVAAGG